MSTREQAQRPLRDLLQRLPRLPLKSTEEIDFEAADADLLVEIADASEITMNVLHHGVGAIGHLLAQSGVAIADGTIDAECIEYLGFLIAELGDLGAQCLTLTAHCRHHTSDYCSPESL